MKGKLGETSTRERLWTKIIESERLSIVVPVKITSEVSKGILEFPTYCTIIWASNKASVIQKTTFKASTVDTV